MDRIELADIAYAISSSGELVLKADESRRVKLPANQLKLLSCLAKNAGNTLSREILADNIWSELSENDISSINVMVSRLRSNMNKLLPGLGSIITTEKGYGYRLILPEKEKSAPAPAPTSRGGDGRQAHIITRTHTSNFFEDRRSVIHRDTELEELEGILACGKTTLLLSGFGGVGKTSLARVLYHRKCQSYDHAGWVEYHGGLKESLLSSFTIADHIPDQEKRWDAISAFLQDSRYTKLLVIDNVDKDEKQGQDPSEDKLFMEISGWANLSIVLTSRLTEMIGYPTYLIGCIGSADAPENCVDLFYFYYNSNTRRVGEAAVYQLVELAGYHTYAIELLAKSARHEDCLFTFLEKVRQTGFKFPTVNIHTKHSLENQSAAEQLGLLFNMESRSALERGILWDFSVLPETARLTMGEVAQLFGYSPDELQPLLRDGWLKFMYGQGIYIHPLVKEIVHFSLSRGKAPRGTAGCLMQLVSEDKLICRDDSQPDVLRRLSYAESAAKYINFESAYEKSAFFFALGMAEYRYARKRLSAVSYIQKALEPCGEIPWAELAEMLYNLGYIKSTTHMYRAEARKDLRAALEIWQSLGGNGENIAKAKDHLGYVLTDTPEDFKEAEALLTDALKIRRDISQSQPTPENIYDYSTTCDNLGFLLAKSGTALRDAEELLHNALRLRESLYSASDKYATDVAWTAYNLGVLLSRDRASFPQAEEHLRRALEIRRGQDSRSPGMYTTNVVFTLVALAKLLAQTDREHELRLIAEEAVELKKSIDSEHMGFFSKEINDDLEILCAKAKLGK